MVAGVERRRSSRRRRAGCRCARSPASPAPRGRSRRRPGRGVDQARGQAGVLRRRAGHRERHQRREGEAGAEAEQQHRAAAGRPRSCRRPACGRRAAARRRSATRPGDQRRRAPKRMISRSEKPSDIVPITSVAGRNASPTSSGVVAEDPLQVERAEEEHPEHPGDEQRLDRVGARRRCASGTSAAASAGWRSAPGGRRRPPAGRARPRRGRASGSSPSRARSTLEDRVDAEHQRAGDQHRAGHVGALREADPRARPRPAAARGSAVATPIGRLTKKIQCQLIAWVRTPPASRPIEPPAEATKP